MNRRSETAQGLALVAMIPLIGWIDYVTGPDIGLSLFYLVPVVWAGWRLAGAWTAAIVVAAAGAWLIAQLAITSAPLGIVGWNGFTRLVIYGAFGAMTSLIRLDRERLQALNQQLGEALEQQTRLARTDALTLLANTRSFTEELEERLERARGTGKPVWLAYVDIDNFKELNDRYGHNAGDDALRRIADALRASVRTVATATREADLAGRLGGDEFAIAFSGADLEGARTIAERLIHRVVELGADYPLAHLGASIGIAGGSGPAGESDAEDLIRRADHAMYRGKGQGKGRAVVEGRD